MDWIVWGMIFGVLSFLTLGAVGVHFLTHKAVNFSGWLYKGILIVGVGLLIFILAVFYVGV